VWSRLFQGSEVLKFLSTFKTCFTLVSLTLSFPYLKFLILPLSKHSSILFFFFSLSLPLYLQTLSRHHELFGCGEIGQIFPPASHPLVGSSTEVCCTALTRARTLLDCVVISRSWSRQLPAAEQHLPGHAVQHALCNFPSQYKIIRLALPA
jgi:hypothetical protein